MILGKIEDYTFVNKYGYAPETYIKVRDLASNNLYLCIVEKQAKSEDLNAIYNVDNYYIFEGEIEIVDDEILNTLAYVDKNDYKDINFYIMVTKWDLGDIAANVFLF